MDTGTTSEPAELTTLEQTIAALEGQRSLLGDRVVETALAPLIDKRDRLLAATVGEQRKLVTVLFADLVDSTPLAQRLDPEDLQAVMSRYMAALRSAVEAEAGVVEKFIGDAVMAAFGLYRAREDDAARAVRAALAMRSAVERLSGAVEAEHGLGLRMRIGIDTGEVVVTGPEERSTGEFLAVGDTMNRAARLQSAAVPGTVLLSVDTARQVRGLFGLRRVVGLQLKGIAGPVDAYVVEAPGREEFWPETRGIEGIETRTVGRDPELHRVQQVFADVVQHRARRILTVLGEAGVGKSRLLREVETWLARLPSEVWVLRGRASPQTHDVANGLLRSVFAERLHIRVTDDPERVHRRWQEGWAELLGGEPSSDGDVETVATWLGFALGTAGRAAVGTADPEGLRRRGSALVLRLLDRLAERAPVVVLLEDLHWADSASLDALEQFAGSRGPGPLLILATARPALLEKRPFWGQEAPLHDSLRLAPLDDDDIRALVAEILQRADRIPAALVELVLATADGNPFYVEELVKWLIEEGIVDTTGKQWRVAAKAVGQVRVPDTLRGLLQARLDSLEPAERSVVGCAAVVGRVFWDEAVSRLAVSIPPPRQVVAFRRLTTREVIVDRPRSTFQGSAEYVFRHALMRDVAYEGVLRSVRRKHHALAAEWLEEVVQRSGRPDEHAAAVAHHYEEAGRPVSAARWYLRAGSCAASTYASDDALRLLSRAHRLVPADHSTLRCDVLLGQELVLDRLGRREDQRTVLDQLGALNCADPARQAQIRLAEGRWLFFRADYPAVLPVAAAATDLARRAGRRDLEADALMHEGRALAYLSEHEAARDRLNRALSAARAVGDHRRAGEILRLLGVVASNQGENDESLELLEAARAEHREIGDREGEAMVTGQVGALLINLGRLEEARLASEAALAVFRTTGHRYREGVMLANLARLAMDEGRLDDALDGARRSLALTEEIDDTEGIVAALHILGDIHRLTGNYGTARDHLQRGLQESRRSALPYFTVHLLASIAAVDLAEGRVQAAVSHATEAQQAASSADVPHAGARADLLAGMARQAAGDRSAVGFLRAAAQRNADVGLDADRRESLAVLAVALLDGGELAAALQVADGLLQEIDGPGAPGAVEPGRVLADVHRVLVAAGDGRAAEVARRAGNYLDEQSQRISDGDLRAGFLGTPINRRLAEIAASIPP